MLKCKLFTQHILTSLIFRYRSYNIAFDITIISEPILFSIDIRLTLQVVGKHRQSIPDIISRMWKVNEIRAQARARHVRSNTCYTAGSVTVFGAERPVITSSHTYAMPALYCIALVKQRAKLPDNSIIDNLYFMLFLNGRVVLLT